MTHTSSKKDNDRIYQNLMYLHKEEHIGNDCLCTTEIAGVYSNLLDEVNKQVAQALKELKEEATLVSVDNKWGGSNVAPRKAVTIEAIDAKIKSLEEGLLDHDRLTTQIK